MKQPLTLTLITLGLVLAIAPSLRAQDATETAPATNTVPAEPSILPYPLSTCVVSGEKLGEMGEPYVFEYEGQEVKLCCKACVKKFEADSKGYMEKLQVTPYPLSVCIVTGEPLEDMGGAVSLIHEGQEVKFCCKGCIKKFNKDPETYLKKMEEATKQ